MNRISSLAFLRTLHTAFHWAGSDDFFTNSEQGLTLLLSLHIPSCTSYFQLFSESHQYYWCVLVSHGWLISLIRRNNEHFFFMPLAIFRQVSLCVLSLFWWNDQIVLLLSFLNALKHKQFHMSQRASGIWWCWVWCHKRAGGVEFSGALCRVTWSSIPDSNIPD